MIVTLKRRGCGCPGTGVITRCVESPCFYAYGFFCSCPHSSSPAVAAELPLGSENLPDLRRERRLDLHQPLVDAYLPSMVHLVGDVKIQIAELRHLLPVHSLHIFSERLFSEIPEGRFSRLHS